MVVDKIVILLNVRKIFMVVTSYVGLKKNKLVSKIIRQTASEIPLRLQTKLRNILALCYDEIEHLREVN